MQIEFQNIEKEIQKCTFEPQSSKSLNSYQFSTNQIYKEVQERKTQQSSRQINKKKQGLPPKEVKTVDPTNVHVMSSVNNTTAINFSHQAKGNSSEIMNKSAVNQSQEKEKEPAQKTTPY